MKKGFSIFLLLSFCLFATAQGTTDGGEPKKEKNRYENEASDRLVFGVSFDNWLYDKDAINSLSTKWNSFGFHFYYQHDLPLGKSRFSFAPGLGISASWVKNNSEIIENDTTVSGSFFQPVEGEFKRNSLMTVFFDVPLEFRYRSNPGDNNKGFKLGVGVINSVRMGGHTKINREVDGNKKVIKEYKFEDLARFRFGPNVRIGYGAFNLFFFYSVTSMFKRDGGPDIRPYSVGFTINGL